MIVLLLPELREAPGETVLLSIEASDLGRDCRRYLAAYR